jgi:hypothetical protein
MKVAFFGYAWNPSMQTDAYMAETIDSLAGAGVDVDVFLGSQLSKEYGIYGLNETVPIDKLARLIAGEGYAAAISFNNAMLIPPVLDAVAGRIVTVIVDEPEHLFDYYRTGPYEVFRRDIEIVAMSSVLERRITEAVDGVESRLHFMLPATNIDLGACSAKAVYPISWVASYVGDLNLDQYLNLIAERPEFHALTVKCIDIIEREGDLRSVKAEDGADAALMRTLPWSFEYFQAQMLNILTNRGRVEAVERLSAHGLALFGNPGWRKLLTYNAAVLASLQSGPALTTHTDLRRVYNASKISINLPQAHVAQDAVQYRVLDVMASNALMITKHSPTSDLYRVFGEDCPIPTYSNLEELETLCVRYLADEKARRAIVAQCNRLVATGFSFAERAADFLRIAGLEPHARASPGSVRKIDLRLLSA